jgi:hypothetical protein
VSQFQQRFQPGLVEPQGFPGIGHFCGIILQFGHFLPHVFDEPYQFLAGLTF